MKKRTFKTALLVVTACAGVYCQAQPLPGIVSWWQGESNLLDSIGGNNLSLYVPPPPINPINYEAGKEGQAFKFNGGRVIIPHNPSLAPSNLTVQAWVKGTGIPAFRYILCKAGGAGAIQYALYAGDTGTARFFVYVPGAYVISPPAPATVWDGNWHHLTGIWDGTGVRFYMDGVEVGTAPGSGSIDYSGPQPLIFGDYQTTAAFPYPGWLDEVKIYSTALTADEVAATYTNANAATASLVSWYKAESNAQDSWGTNNGSDGLGVPPPPHVFTYASGKNDTGFFVKNGVAIAPDSETLKPANFTAQAWVKSVAPGPFRYIMAKTRGVDSYSWGIYTEDGGGIDFLVNVQGIGLLKSPAADSASIWDGAWHLATATFDGTTARLFLDGRQVGSGTPAAGAIDYSDPKELIIGDYRKDGGLPFWGQVDDVQIYGRVLTPEEIRGIYTQNKLVSFWPASSTADDVIGTNNGTLTGTAVYGMGRLEQGAFNFKAGGSVQIPDSASLRPNNVTVQAMVSAKAPGANKFLISKSNTSSDPSYGFFTGPSGGLAFCVMTAGGRVVSPATDATIWDGSFHAIAGVYDGAKVRLYVDGKEIGSGTTTSGNIVYGSYQSGKLLFGDFSETTGSAAFPGTIDDVKIYNTALTAKEVADNAFLPVLIINQPQSQAFTPGSPVTLSVLAQAPSAMTYEWTRNGEVIPGATGASIVLTNPQAASYAVKVSAGESLYSTGKVGMAYNSGAGGIARIPNSPEFYTNNAFSIQLWAKSSGPGNFKYLVSKSRHPSWFSSSYGLYTGDQNGLKMFVVLEPALIDGDMIAASTSSAIWDDTWHHITGSWDGQIVRLYVDGVLVNQADSFGGGTISYTNNYLNGDILLGDVNAPGATFHFPGRLDEVKFFSRALTDQEVADQYASATSTSGADALVSWWKIERDLVDAQGRNTGYILPPIGSLTSEPAVLSIQAVVPVLGAPALVGGNFQANVTGGAGTSYVVYRSSDLTNWTPIVTNAAPFTFTDPAGAGGKFYRARSQ